MSSAIITVENLGKRYRLGASRTNERYTALRDVVSEAAKKPFRAMRANVGKWTSANGSASGSASSSPSNVPTFKPSHSTPEDFWALKNASFEVEKAKWSASWVRNGAGKSTL